MIGWASDRRAAWRACRRKLEASFVVRGELPVGAAREGAIVGAIELVAHDGRAERREMHADLVLPARLERATTSA